MNCPLCNNKIGIFKNRLSMDGVLCKECSDKIIEEIHSKYSNKRCRKCFHKTKYYEDLDAHKCDNCEITYSLEEAKKMPEYGIIDDSFDFMLKWVFIGFKWAFITFLFFLGLYVLLEFSEMGWIGVIFIFFFIFSIFYNPIGKK